MALLPGAVGAQAHPMTIVDPRTWLEHLTQRRCWELLAATPVGRLGYAGPQGPEILPVNYAVDGDSIVFRTDQGTKLHALGRDAAVCFEIDAIDPGASTGWSVLVKGRAHHVGATAEIIRLRELDLRYWSIGEKPHWIRILPTEVSGRRIHQPDRRTDQ
jgi:nitroimidazol reductase NimA-like FMN-containing flavoprotein (pyridoxamine 5'-phosphate oxidase superfamily)